MPVMYLLLLHHVIITISLQCWGGVGDEGGDAQDTMQSAWYTACVRYICTKNKTIELTERV